MTGRVKMDLSKVPFSGKGHQEEANPDNSPHSAKFLGHLENPEQGIYPEKLSGMDNAARMSVPRPAFMEGSQRKEGVNPDGEVHRASNVDEGMTFESMPNPESYSDPESRAVQFKDSEFPDKPRSSPKNLPPHNNPFNH